LRIAREIVPQALPGLNRRTGGYRNSGMRFDDFCQFWRVAHGRRGRKSALEIARAASDLSIDDRQDGNR
jgi:hypothetical protein